MLASLATSRATSVAIKAFRRRHDRRTVFAVAQSQERRLQAQSFGGPSRPQRGVLVCRWHISPETGKPVCGWHIEGDARRKAQERTGTDAEYRPRRSLREVA